jgi:hypothetical protein
VPLQARTAMDTERDEGKSGTCIIESLFGTADKRKASL